MVWWKKDREERRDENENSRYPWDPIRKKEEKKEREALERERCPAPRTDGNPKSEEWDD